MNLSIASFYAQQNGTMIIENLARGLARWESGISRRSEIAKS